MIRLYRRAQVSSAEVGQAVEAAEWCFYVEANASVGEGDTDTLGWLLGETFDPDGLSRSSFLGDCRTVLEIGPRLNFETAWASTARQVCLHVGLSGVERVERSRRLGFSAALTEVRAAAVLGSLHDRMTQVAYPHPLETFGTPSTPAPTRRIPLLAQGPDALRAANVELGLAMDDRDVERYWDLFANRLQRDPTDVELFQLGQGNSEHSRHGFFRGALSLDGRDLDTSLMAIVMAPWVANPNNSVIAFHDDSSAIRGPAITALVPEDPGGPSRFVLDTRIHHPTLTAETHNFPTGIAPYPGAATGTGGRIRDNQCVGRGGLVVASGAAYCVGNLHIPGYEQPWEDDGHGHPGTMAPPLEILVAASNGASDYGNCFGEPLILGHARSFGMRTADGHRAWLKPIMYTEGIGAIDARHVDKGAPADGMLVVQIGGPAFRIGMGGGAASSLMSGENAAELDFNAVQRGAPDMGQRVNRVIRACVEMGDANPIIAAHDLGAGGDSNALPEILDPAGGRIDLRSIPVGDVSLSVLEIWGNEAQERNALLLWPHDLERFRALCARESAPCAVVGEVTGDGRLVVLDSRDATTPVDMPLGPILGEAAVKDVELRSVDAALEPLRLPVGLTVEAALQRVLRLVSVASKRWLTTKVDRSVTGLVAQQQCVGPHQTPLSDHAIVAHGLFGLSGTAVSQGERPGVGLVSPQAQGRMSVGEALTNLAGARITGLQDVRCSANWMWAAKLEGEGARLHGAAQAMSTLMVELGMAVDGGKDSLSMACTDGSGTVAAPGQLVVAPYAVMPDVRRAVTPDLKAEGNALLLVDLGGGRDRLGGSALAQVYSQVGDSCPDVDDAAQLRGAFEATQELIDAGRIVALHDRADGGLVVTLVEMAIAGNRGASVATTGTADPLPALFSEELGLILEVAQEDVPEVVERFSGHGLDAVPVGVTGGRDQPLRIVHNGEVVLDRPVHALRGAWEETSARLDELQADPECVREETASLRRPLVEPSWRLTFTPQPTQPSSARPLAAVLREAGTNGDREMAAALMAGGFEVWDVTTSDLLAGRVTLAQFAGLVFAGGFSFGDVLDAGKAWAGVIRFNPTLAEQFEAFRRRPDTFSLGVCNGAQLMALLGWVPDGRLADARRPRFVANRSGRFESRLATVDVLPSPAIMFDGMVGSRLGIWVAHGEGRLHIEDETLDRVLALGLAPLRFVDSDGNPTARYPDNPNGSPLGITGLCSEDGRHLALMPHPERLANQLWQWPWLPAEWSDLEASPWLRLFQNAHRWCLQQSGWCARLGAGGASDVGRRDSAGERPAPGASPAG